jgi:hypothetical protein
MDIRNGGQRGSRLPTRTTAATKREHEGPGARRPVQRCLGLILAGDIGGTNARPALFEGPTEHAKRSLRAEHQSSRSRRGGKCRRRRGR